MARISLHPPVPSFGDRLRDLYNPRVRVFSIAPQFATLKVLQCRMKMAVGGMVRADWLIAIVSENSATR